MEEKEIKAYFRRFHKDHGLSKHPSCPICNKDIMDTDKVEATKSREGIVVVHSKCYKKEITTWTTPA